MSIDMTGSEYRNPARGCLIGLLLSIPLWIGIIAALWPFIRRVLA